MGEPEQVSPTEFVVRAEGIDPNHLMLEGVNDLVVCPKCKGEPRLVACPTCDGGGKVHHPTYTVSEVAKVFFDKSGHWVRWRERQGAFVLDGEESGTRTKHGARIYTLPDVERMAHGLATNGHIEPRTLLLVLNVVRAEAMLYGFLL